MRRSAVIETAHGLGVHDHVGWVFGDPADFGVHAGRFLAAGERVIYVAGDGTTQLQGVDGLDAALSSNQAQITSVADMYCAGVPVDAQRQVAAFARATEQAITDGWTGLRVAADVTSLVLTPRQRAAWIRYEHLVDSFMVRNPVAGFCGFHRGALDGAALNQVACLHPLVNPGASEFRLYTAPRADVSLVLAGEIDLSNRQVFATALRQARPAPVADRLLVDAAPLVFIDHHGVAELAGYAAELGVTAVVYAEPDSVFAGIIRVLSMPGVRVVAPR